MYWHTPSVLPGPISRNRAWWKSSDTETPPAEDIRADLVARVRKDIAEGRYDTPEKWDAALERMLTHLGRA